MHGSIKDAELERYDALIEQTIQQIVAMTSNRDFCNLSLKQLQKLLDSYRISRKRIERGLEPILDDEDHAWSEADDVPEYAFDQRPIGRDH